MIKRIGWFFSLIVISGIFSASLTALANPSPATQTEKVLHLGVYQHQSKATLEKRFTPFAQYLSNALPNHQVKLHVLKNQALRQGARSQSLDMLLVNPNLYEIIRHETPVNGITATVETRYKEHRLSKLGGVIFSRADQPHLNSLAALQQQRIAIPSLQNTGAYRIPLFELHQQNLAIDSIDFITVGNNDAVVQAVLDGKADAGFVRTGILEHWQTDYGLDLQQINIINPQKRPDFPQLLSTELYPEWPFVILPGHDGDLNRDIAVALFALRSNHPAAQQAKISGFVAPRDYQGFAQMLRELRLEPYNEIPSLTLGELWQQHKISFLLTLILLVSVIALLMLSERLRVKMQQNAQQLQRQHQIDHILLNLPIQAEQLNEQGLLEWTLEQLDALTQSKGSFVHYVHQHSQQILMAAFSKQALQLNSNLVDSKRWVPINANNKDTSKPSIWSQVIHNGQTHIDNDFASRQHSHTLPKTHMPLKRILVTPVQDNQNTVLLVGLANKPDAYTQADSDVVQIISNELWRLLKDQRTQVEISTQRSKYQRLLNDLGNDYAVFSHNGLEGIVTYLSEGFTTIFAQPVSAVLGKPWSHVINWEHSAIVAGKQAVEDLVSKKVTENNIQMSFVLPQGGKKTLKIQQHGVYKNGHLIAVDGFIQDITQTLANQIRLQQAAQVFDHTTEGIFITDKNNCIERVNHQFEHITGYSEQEVIGRNPRLLSSGQQSKAFYKTLWHSLQSQHFWQGEVWNRRKNGEFYPQSLKISVILDEQNQAKQYLAILNDITLEKAHQKELERRAYHDALTDLPNRLLFTDRLNQSLASAERRHHYVAVLFLDLDGFKLVNDTHDHQAGDFLLQSLARRLQKLVRQEDTVARLGGDEFAILIHNSQDTDFFAQIENRILVDIQKKVWFEHFSLQVSCSIGAVYYKPSFHPEVGSEALLRLADQAMYHAKKLGKNQVCHHQWQSTTEVKALYEALAKHQFELFFHPKVNYQQPMNLNFEGLIRWQHPTKGLLSPDKFLPLITEAGLDNDLTHYVLNEGLQTMHQLQQQGIWIKLSLNMNARFALEANFINTLKACFKRFPEIDPKRLTLEILESSELGNPAKVAHKIIQAQTLGVRFAIDDFGTGHASLDYLKNLPVNEVKIDQAFIRNIFNEPNSLTIIEAIKSMAEAFNLQVIAEGAETNAHIKLLRQTGIDRIQGYAIAQPMPFQALQTWIKEWRPHPEHLHLSEYSSNNKQLLNAELTLKSKERALENLQQHNDNISTDFAQASLQLDASHCEFGQWLHSVGKRLFTDTKQFENLDRLHEAYHAQALQALRAHEQGNNVLFKTILQQMQTLKDEMVQALYQ